MQGDTGAAAHRHAGEEEEREDENIVNKLTTNTYINTFMPRSGFVSHRN